jgi:hypothetical protein
MLYQKAQHSAMLGIVRKNGHTNSVKRNLEIGWTDRLEFKEIIIGHDTNKVSD